MTRNISLLLLAASLALSTNAVAKTSDRNQRTNIGADSNDCSVNDAGPCVFTGDVVIDQGTLNIQAARADITRAGGEVSKVKLTGAPVKLKQQNDDGAWMNATSSQIDYDLPNDIIVFTGNAVVQQPGRGSMSGGRIVYNTRTGQVQSGGTAGGGRVSMTFEPKNKGKPTDGTGKPARATDDTSTPAPQDNPPAPQQDSP